jgi:hypothetical protein
MKPEFNPCTGMRLSQIDRVQLAEFLDSWTSLIPRTGRSIERDHYLPNGARAGAHDCGASCLRRRFAIEWYVLGRLELEIGST